MKKDDRYIYNCLNYDELLYESEWLGTPSENDFSLPAKVGYKAYVRETKTSYVYTKAGWVKIG